MRTGTALVGTAESLSFLRTPGGPVAPAGRTLDPLPYLAVVAGAFVAPDQLPIAPLQLSGAPEPGATTTRPRQPIDTEERAA